MTTFEQDGTEYSFPSDGCEVLPDFDKQDFYKHLSGAHGIEAKGCDILAVRHGNALYLIEAKDYAHATPSRTRPKAGELATTIARKAFDTLACLVIGAHHARTEHIRTFCRHALACPDLYIVATVELVRIPKTLQYRANDMLYLRDLREQLERYTKGLRARKVIVTWNDNEHGDKFWTSHWAASHD